MRPIAWRSPGPSGLRPRLWPIRVIKPAKYDDQAGPPIQWGPLLIAYAARHGASRSLYRIFNAAEYRFYRSNVAPPDPSDTPFATNSTLAFTPSDTFADGTWYLSVSYFNGVLDSGFLPLGPQGQTYRRLVIASGVDAPQPPSPPTAYTLEVRAGGVIRVVAYYSSVSDGTNKANQWGISYTTNGSTPAVNSAGVLVLMAGGPFDILSYDLPAQADGTTVKVQIQTIRSADTAYSDPITPLVATAVATGPAGVPQAGTWPGVVTDGE